MFGGELLLAWHVATTKPFSEMIAEEALKQKGFQPFNPKCYSVRVVKGRRTWTERCYMPGYIFIRFDSVDDRWPVINNTRGIRSLLYSAVEKPAPLREAVMQSIIDRCNGDGVVKEEELDLALTKVIPIGTMVRLLEGPFQGFSGPVIARQSDRVKVMLSLFGRPTETKVDLKSLELA